MPKNDLISLLYRWRVRAALLAAILVLLLARPTVPSLWGGMVVCSAGLLIRAWASGHLKKEKELATSGPYQYCRNPLYLGNFILGLGMALGSGSLWVLAVFILYFLLFYPAVILRETRRMIDLFPEKYEDYRKRVPLFFPAFRSSAATPSKFRWARYMNNKEYRAIFGTLVFFLLLAAKHLLLKP